MGSAGEDWGRTEPSRLLFLDERALSVPTGRHEAGGALSGSTESWTCAK